jgi:RNA polymerase sigma-70 factor (ECF subfamily)
MEVVQGPDNNREERLNRMVWQYEKDLIRICSIYLRDASLAQDAVQETFLRAYKNMSAFRGDSGEKTWLIQIAMNVCKDFRKSAWYRFVDRRVSLEHLPIPSAPPSLEHMTLTAEIMRLPRKHMEVVMLYFYERMTIREIAKVLGISQSAVSQRLSKAKSRLHDVLEGGDGR